MKKIIALLLTLTLLCCATMALAEDPQAGLKLDADFEAFIDRADKAAQDGAATLLMTANPTTGYDWQYVVLDDEVASVTAEFINEGGEDALPGQGGMYSFVIKGLKAGETVVAFEYNQSWDDTSTVVALTYFVTVDENLRVTLSGGTVGV